MDKVAGKSLIDDTKIAKLDEIYEGATKTEQSSVNGSIKINGVEKTVYALPPEVLHSADTLILDGGNA